MNRSKHKECERQFTQLSRAWYGDACLKRGEKDSITMGFYHPDGGTTGEFTIEWIEIGGEDVPCLKVFSDAWDALYEFWDVVEHLSLMDGTNPPPDEIALMLKQIGIIDATNEKSPYE